MSSSLTFPCPVCARYVTISASKAGGGVALEASHIGPACSTFREWREGIGLGPVILAGTPYSDRLRYAYRRALEQTTFRKVAT